MSIGTVGSVAVMFDVWCTHRSPSKTRSMEVAMNRWAQTHGHTKTNERVDIGFVLL